MSPSRLIRITCVWSVQTCWVNKETINICSNLSYFKGPWLFISCTLDNNPKKAQHFLCQEEEWSSESLTGPRSCCFTADSIPGNACWLFTHCSLHTIMLLPLPLALTRMPTSAPCCCTHVAFGQFRPHVTPWSKAVATFQQLTTVFRFDHDSWFLSKVHKTRAALNSQSQRKKDHRSKQGKAKLPKVSFNNSFKVTLAKPRGGGQSDLAFKSILV